MAILIADQITKKYSGKIAVNQLSLSVDEGQLIAFLGPNGAGKSTSIGMLTGIIKPTSGLITINGLHPNNHRYVNQIGVVFQTSVLDKDLSVKKNLLSRAKMYSHLDANKRVMQLVNLFQLESFENQRYGILSGGQKRRVDIARAIIQEPRILFLDEPSTGLDIQTRNLIWSILQRLRNQTHLTIILTTHYLEEAENADFVYIMDHGQLIAAGTVPELKHQYAPNILSVQTANSDEVLSVFPNNWQVIEQSSHSIVVRTPDSKKTIKILSQILPLIDTFEFRQGNIDDIFVALTGKEIR